jgi:hypothetical protein
LYHLREGIQGPAIASLHPNERPVAVGVVDHLSIFTRNSDRAACASESGWVFCDKFVTGLCVCEKS